jgi:hypothetical protein
MKTADRNRAAKVARFRTLHHGEVFVLPNAWDAASAAIVEAMGAPAVATTSGGISWAFGRADAQGLRREDMLAATARIVRTVKIPVSADIEGGYGLDPRRVAETVRAIIGVGAVSLPYRASRSSPCRRAGSRRCLSRGWRRLLIRAGSCRAGDDQSAGGWTAAAERHGWPRCAPRRRACDGRRGPSKCRHRDSAVGIPTCRRSRQ